MSEAHDVLIRRITAKQSHKVKETTKMALTRKLLSSMGIEADKVDEIIEAHVETVNAVKAERDDYKTKAGMVDELQTKLDQANKAIEDNGSDAYKVKYEAIKEEFEAYKADQLNKETTANKVTAYRQLLKDAGVSEKRIDAILKVTDLSKEELKDGKLVNAEKLTEGIKTEWADFITTTETKGADTVTPPDATGDKPQPKAIPTIF